MFRTVLSVTAATLSVKESYKLTSIGEHSWFVKKNAKRIFATKKPQDVITLPLECICI